MKQRVRQLTALILALAMCLSLFSANVWAAEIEPLEDGSMPAQSIEEVAVEEVSEPEDVLTEETTEPKEEPAKEDIPAQEPDARPKKSSDECELTGEAETDANTEENASEEESSLTTQGVIASGSCGDEFSWKIENGKLIISNTDSIGKWFHYKDAYGLDFSESSISKIVLSNGIEVVYTEAFHGLSNIKSVQLPSTLQSIGKYAFEGCSITDIVIPSSVTLIRDGAFKECKKLTKIYFTGDAPQIEANAFEGVTATAYYPANNKKTWTTKTRKNYGGKITWKGDVKKSIHALVINGIAGDADFGCDNDAALMYTRLCDNKLSGYNINKSNIHVFSYNCEQDATTVDDINSRIKYSFNDTDSDDLSFFYYTGHTTWNGESAREYGITLGDGWYRWNELATYLSQNIKGEIVVIMDACFSGNFISTGLSSLSKEDKARFSVITSCSEREESSTKNLTFLLHDKLSYGCFTYYLGEGIGFFKDSLKADSNKDNKITLKELFNYVNKKVKDKTKKQKYPMSVLMYGQNDQLVLFEYKSKNSITKKEQVISLKTPTKKYTAKSLRKKKQSFSIGAKAKGKITYSVNNGKKYIIVNSKGKVKVKKGAKKGTYRITVRAGSTKKYNSAAKYVTIYIK